MSSITELLSHQQSDESVSQNIDQNPDVVALDDEAAEEVFSSLSSATARSILTVLYDQPMAASEVAEEVGTSLQNVNYHLNNLRNGGLIEAIDTSYSDQGKEMKVYAPTNKALVIFAGNNIHHSSLLDTIKGLVGLIGIFAIMSIIIDRAARHWVASRGVEISTTKSTGGQQMFLLPPGLLVFLGSILALLVVAGWWSYRSL
jgi:DNA-binding transcriptional ArsR family regulator